MSSSSSAMLSIPAINSPPVPGNILVFYLMGVMFMRISVKEGMRKPEVLMLCDVFWFEIWEDTRSI